jgi:hypothetical protein
MARTTTTDDRSNPKVAGRRRRNQDLIAGLTVPLRDVRADGLLAEHKVAGDLAVGAAGDDVGEDLPFAGGGRVGRLFGRLAFFDRSK